MAAEFDIQPQMKRQKYDVFDENLCVFCGIKFKDDKTAIIPDINRMNTLFEACRQRLDDVGNRLLEYETDIRQQQVSFRYHRNCRASYASPAHIKRIVQKRLSSEPVAGTSTCDKEVKSPRITRHTSGGTIFDWKRDCFICGKPCHKQKKLQWAMVESSIDKGGDTMYTKVLLAAKEKNDDSLLVRLCDVPNGDLVAIEARYHRKRSCYISYVSSKSVQLAQRLSKSKSLYDKALHQLVEEYKSDIDNKQVFTLSAMLSRYQEILMANDIEVSDSERYTSQKLKSKLLTQCSDLAFIPRPGLSDLVCSVNITVGDALRKADALIGTLHETVDSMYIQSKPGVNDTTNMSDVKILHTAAGILRRRMSSTKKLENEYYSFDEMSLIAEKEFVDPLLYQFIIWLTDSEMYRSGDHNDSLVLNPKCLHFACDITTTAATGIISPKHLGLAVHLHHDFGSRKLIDCLYSLGYTMSYTELRQFTTSVAQYVSSLQIPSPVGSYIPPELMPVTEDGSFIVAAADNWDHNERTIDGKQTTHAMTSIVVQSQTDSVLTATRITRTSARSLDTTDIVLETGCDLKTVLDYKKPSKRPEPTFSQPVSLNEISQERSDQSTDATLIETMYNLSRSGAFHNDGEGHAVPPWKRFHATLTNRTEGPACSSISRIAFNPIIMAPPTNIETVYTTLMRLKETVNTLGQENVPIFFDMGLLTKALEIVWSKPEELEGVIPCEGGMHLMMSVVSAIGYVYGDAGLKQLLCDSGVFAAGTVNMMLSGKDFDRAMYGLKLIDEALHARLYHQFIAWCGESNKRIPEDVLALVHKFEVSVSLEDRKDIDHCISQLRLDIPNKVQPLLEEFAMAGRAVSPTFMFWYDFLRYVLQPVKLFLSSTRNGNWTVQQETKLQFLPLLFVANRTNYARYLTVNQLLMNRLPDNVLSNFQDGKFVAKLTSGHFNTVWLDYTIEATENKALKGTGGIIGLTLRGPALMRWFLARPVTSQYALKFNDNVAAKTKHGCKERRVTETSAERRWASDVQKLCDMFESSFIDPFDINDAPEHLVNIATGSIAPADIEESLINAIDKGTTMLKKFVKDRLIDPDSGDDHSRKSLYDPLPRSGLKTMSEMRKSIKLKKKNVSLDGEMMYLRLLAANAKKKVPLARVMSFENTPVPLSMFSEDGKMVSSAKSQLVPCLEGFATSETSTTMPDCDAIIFNGHACIQMMNEPTRHTVTITFEDMAKAFYNFILYRSRLSNNGKPVQQVHVVFDKYLEGSIKDQTREKRTSGVQGRAIEVRPDIRIPPNWKQFLGNCKNKSALAQFYTTYMCNNGSMLADNQTLFISGGQGDTAVKVTMSSVADVPELHSNQEEADTRIVLHCVEASKRGAETIVVSSPDTDVLVLLIHHRPEIVGSKLFFLTGRTGKHANLVRYIPVHEIYTNMSPPQRNFLLPMYCLTGCDTTSSFFGHGKRSAFRILKQKSDEYGTLAELGITSEMSKSQFVQSMMFVGSLYGKKDCVSLNSLRCEKAEKNVSGKKLPPTENSFCLHVRRCVYQLLLWRMANIPSPVLPNPCAFGYEQTETGSLQPQLMSQSPAAPELLNNLVCECTNACSEGCSCVLNDQTCTAACKCEASVEDMEDNRCSNPLTVEVSENLNVQIDDIDMDYPRQCD